jgi:hypothetical protein
MKPLACVVGSILLLSAHAARAQSAFARPPDGYWEGPRAFDPPESTVRLNVGPALRIGSAPMLGGLAAAVDVGARAAGARISGSWFRAGSDGGLSQYAAELWIDFGAPRRLRPIVAAGAGVARLDANDARGSLETSTVGVAVLRAALEYVLPIAGVDGRVGVDVEGAVPAIRSNTAPDVAGWLTAAARVGVGF